MNINKKKEVESIPNDFTPDNMMVSDLQDLFYHELSSKLTYLFIIIIFFYLNLSPWHVSIGSIWLTVSNINAVQLPADSGVCVWIKL